MNPIKNKLNKKFDVFYVSAAPKIHILNYKTLRDARRLGWCSRSFSMGQDIRVLLQKQRRSSQPNYDAN